MTRAFSFSESVLRELPEELSAFSLAGRPRLEWRIATACFSREVLRLLASEDSGCAGAPRERLGWIGEPSTSVEREDLLHRESVMQTDMCILTEAFLHGSEQATGQYRRCMQTGVQRAVAVMALTLQHFSSITHYLQSELLPWHLEC